MDKICLSVDVGSKNFVIAGKDSHNILNEPSVVAGANVGGKFEHIACGNEAFAHAAQNLDVQLIYPIEKGRVKNDVAFVYMLKTFINRIAPKRFLKNYVSANVNVSCGLSNIEKRAFEDCFCKAGVKEVVIIESPISVKACNNDKVMFMVNIGASLTEIALVTDEGIVNGCSIDVGGDDIDNEINDYVSETFKLLINKQTSENIKTNLANFDASDLSIVKAEANNVVRGNTEYINLTATELRPIITNVADKIIDVVSSVMLMTPKNYQYAIAQNGIYLLGGTSKLKGIAQYFSDRLFVDVKVMEQPDLVVAEGGSKFFYDISKLARMLNIDNLK